MVDLDAFDCLLWSQQKINVSLTVRLRSLVACAVSHQPEQMESLAPIAWGALDQANQSVYAGRQAVYA